MKSPSVQQTSNDGASILGAESTRTEDPEDQARTSKASGRRIKSREAGPALGKALRSIYDQALDEAIPSGMLDLLKRLD